MEKLNFEIATTRKTPSQRMSIYRELVKILPFVFDRLKGTTYDDIQFKKHVYAVLKNNPSVRAKFVNETDLTLEFSGQPLVVSLKYSGDKMTLECGFYDDTSCYVAPVCLLINFMFLLVEKFDITEEVEKILSAPEPICMPKYAYTQGGAGAIETDPHFVIICEKYRHLQLVWGAVLPDKLTMPKTYNGVIKDLFYYQK